MSRRTRSFDLLDAVAFKLRGLLMVPVVAFVFLCIHWEWEFDPGIWGLGLPLFFSGLALRIWAQRYLGYRLQKEHALAVTGPYVFCRNPVYIGNMLVLAGLTVLCELVWAVPPVVLWVTLVYARAVRFEEVRLTKRFGTDYLSYRHAVPRWWPRRRPPKPNTCAKRSSLPGWGRAFSAEWHCLLLLLIPAIKELVTNLPTYDSQGPWLVSLPL